MSDTTDRSYDPATAPLPSDRARIRPGWTEIVVGIVAVAVITFGLTIPVHSAVDAPTFGLFLTALSAIAAGGGFLVAVAVRVRSWAAFGIVRTSARWLVIGLAGGVVAFVLKFPVTWAYVTLTGDAGNPQTVFSDAAASTGVVSLVLTVLFLDVLTPIGEELFFRGVITTALLRYRPVVAVVGSAVIFAVLHGELNTMLTALIVGLIAGELRRRSGSVWPGVVVHVVLNLLAGVLGFVVAPALGL